MRYYMLRISLVKLWQNQDANDNSFIVFVSLSIHLRMNTLPEDGLKQTFSPKKDSYLSDPWMYDSQLTLFMFFFLKICYNPGIKLTLKNRTLGKEIPLPGLGWMSPSELFFFLFILNLYQTVRDHVSVVCWFQFYSLSHSFSAKQMQQNLTERVFQNFNHYEKHSTLTLYFKVKWNGIIKIKLVPAHFHNIL